MLPPLFSILIANYNNGRFLEEAVNSIYNQSYPNWEIIIVDDCSMDNSSDIYNRLKSNSQIKIYFNEENKGVGYSKRKCIEKSTGSLCGFLDPDDTLTNNALEQMVQAHANHPKASLIYSKYFVCDQNLNVKYIFKNKEGFNHADPYFFNIGGYISHFATFKKEFYLKTTGIDPFLKRAADQDLYLKLYEVGETYFLQEPLYYYRIHKAGISTLENEDKAFFWFWVIIINTAKRRGLNLEDFFYENFVRKYKYDILAIEHSRLIKYQKLNNTLSKIKRIFIRK